MTELAARRLRGRVLVAGRARGEALVLDEPLSFWGGLDAASGRIIDAHHPQRGMKIAGRVLVMPGGRGSSSSSSVLAEAIRLRTGPAAIVLAAPDEIVALGALIPRLLDGASCPVLCLTNHDFAAIASTDIVTIDEQGELTVSRPSGVEG